VKTRIEKLRQKAKQTKIVCKKRKRNKKLKRVRQNKQTVYDSGLSNGILIMSF